MIGGGVYNRHIAARGGRGNQKGAGLDTVGDNHMLDPLERIHADHGNHVRARP